MASYKVTFEGETLESDDDKFVEFTKAINVTVTIPDDFMPKMFEYLESDLPYEILYQIKSIVTEPENKSVNPDAFVSIVAEYSDGSKGGILLEDQDGALSIRGYWNFQDFNKIISDVYSNPDSFKLVVVTIAEDLAP